MREKCIHCGSEELYWDTTSQNPMLRCEKWHYMALVVSYV